MSIEYKINTASKSQIQSILLACDDYFIPKLSERVDISEYSQKIFDKSSRFEAWDGNNLVGLIAMYENGYITNVSVLSAYNNKGIASSLLAKCIEYSIQKDIKSIELEVNEKNITAISLYNKYKFAVKKEENSSKIMKLEL